MQPDGCTTRSQNEQHWRHSCSSFDVLCGYGAPRGQCRAVDLALRRPGARRRAGRPARLGRRRSRTRASRARAPGGARRRASSSSCSPWWWATTSRRSSRKLSGTPGRRGSSAARTIGSASASSAAAATSSAVGSKASTSWATSLVSPRLLVVDAPADDHDLVHVDLVGVRRVGGVEDEQLDLALEVVERGEHHRVALLGPDPLALGDHAADGDPLAVLLARRGRRASSRPAPAAPAAPP